MVHNRSKGGIINCLCFYQTLTKIACRPHTWSMLLPDGANICNIDQWLYRKPMAWAIT